MRISRDGLGLGDVIVSQEGPWYVSLAIRLGAALQGRPPRGNHVMVVVGLDNDQIRVIEATARGMVESDVSTRSVGWYATNGLQPRTDIQRAGVVASIRSLLGRPYDWFAIADEVLGALHIDPDWAHAEWPDTGVPGSLICSASADWAHEQNQLPNPGGYGRTRFTTPGDWDYFLKVHHWEVGGPVPRKYP